MYNSLTHSAHICGLMSNHLNFRLERIIALDPARPLIRPGNQNRLDTGDARAVQVIHTNAGYYGEAGRIGHIDFCVNGGRRCGRFFIFLCFTMIHRDNWTKIYFQTTILHEHNKRQSLFTHLVGLLFGCISVRQGRDDCRAMP